VFDCLAVMSFPMSVQDPPQDRHKALRIVQVGHVVARKLDELHAKAGGKRLTGPTVVVRPALVPSREDQRHLALP
jgi:hypothetical protein